MYLARTFTNNGTGAGAKQQLNFVTWLSGVHCNAAMVALMYAAYQKWNTLQADASPNVANIYRYPRVHVDEILCCGTTAITASGVLTRYNAVESQVCAFAGSGNPTNATGIEGFVLQIVSGTSGSDAISAKYEFFVPFYNLKLAMTLTSFDVGNVTASA